MSSPVLTFGRHRGQTVEQLPEDYVRWLAAPKTDGKYPPLPDDIQAAVKERLIQIEADKAAEEFAGRALGGHPTDMEAPIYVIECEGDCHSKSGSFAIDNRWFPSLEGALAFLSEEYPLQTETIDGKEFISRLTPDPEDDRILIWEILPSGHRRAVWGFFGWHWSHSEQNYACGQGKLPGDDDDLFLLAVRDI